MRAHLLLPVVATLATMILVFGAVTQTPSEPPRGPGVIYVDDSSTNGLNDGSSWENAYVHLQDALANAGTNGSVSEIWVAEGTYKPDHGRDLTPGDRNASFHLIAGMSLYGGFAGNESSLDERDFRANRTILSGDLNGDDAPAFINRTDNGYHVIVGSAASSTTFLDGLIVRGGCADGSGDNADGGGAFIVAGVPVFLNCVFERNSASFGGALYNRGGHVSVVNCFFAGNRGFRGSAPARGPQSWGSGAAILNTAGGRASITNCVFQCNAADASGGAMYNVNACATLTNCTVSGNTAAASAGGLLTGGSSPAALTVSNSVLWGNADSLGNTQSSQIARLESAPILVNYSCVQGWTGALGGFGNHGQDPHFVYGAGVGLPVCGEHGTGPDFDLHLEPGSAAIDAGSNAADTDLCAGGSQSIPVTDLGGLPRFRDDPLTPNGGVGLAPIVDQGAFEFQPVDCNANGVPDSQDVLSGTSVDCDDDGNPDECEAPDAVLETELTASDAAAGEHFGEGLAIDGDTVVVVKRLGVSAYVFRRGPEGWAQEAELVAPGQTTYQFRGPVSISGNVIVLSAQEGASGAAYVFRRVGALWLYESRLVSPLATSYFGSAVAVHGDVAVVGRPAEYPAPSGAAFVFRYNGVAWVNDVRLLPPASSASATFGSEVAINGDTIAVSGFVFRHDGSHWQREGQLALNRPAALSGDRAVVGRPYDNTVQVFRRDGATWSLEDILAPTIETAAEEFGTSTSITGDLILVGSTRSAYPPPSHGSAFLFRHNGIAWVQVEHLSVPDAENFHGFGDAVGISGLAAMISAPNDSDAANDAGSVYVFELRTDCNTNGVLDACDILTSGADCNHNLAPDSCDLESGRSTDCDYSGVPDECEIAAGTASNCNHNAAPDSCDIAEGRSTDSNSNGLPDECEVDCNANGTFDSLDLILATSRDCNLSGTPDECEGYVAADLDCDVDVDADDLAGFRACHPFLGEPTPPGCGIADLNRDGEVDCADWRILRDAWTAGPPPNYPPCHTVRTVTPIFDE